MRTFLALVAAAMLLAAGCGNDHRATSAATSSPAADAASTVTPAQPAATVSTDAGAADPAAVAAPSDDAAAARGALDAYLDAIVRRDPRAALDHSSGAAAGLATIRLAIAEINATRGGRTTVALQGASFAPATDTADVVVFDGSVHLVTDVTGSFGDQHSDDVVSGPITVKYDGVAWTVDGFAYNGASMTHAESGHSQTVDGVTLSVAFVQSYGGTTAVVVGLGADGGTVDVTLQQAELTTSAGATAVAGDFTPEAQPVGILNGARTDASPARFDATFRRGDGSTTSFSIAL